MSQKSRLTVRLQPRASRDEILEMNDAGVLRVRVKAPPVDGAANVALLHLLAEQVGIARSKVRIVTGASSRTKIVEFEGVTDNELKSRWYPH